MITSVPTPCFFSSFVCFYLSPDQTTVLGFLMVENGASVGLRNTLMKARVQPVVVSRRTDLDQLCNGRCRR